MRLAEVLALLALAWVVAVPLTLWFARASWPSGEPVAALVAWQAIGLSGGLALLSAEVTLVAIEHAGPWPNAVVAAVRHPGSDGPVGTVSAALLGLSVGWLFAVLIGSFVLAGRTRREHRLLLELLSRPDGGPNSSFEVIDGAAPVAYAVPGRTPHIVLSSAARARLDERELQAVLAHERAHLRQRHTLLVQPFIAWRRSVPVLAAPEAACARVQELVEMVCDDAARSATGPSALAGALAGLAPSGTDIAERLDRLHATPPGRWLRATMLAAAMLLVVTPPVLLVFLG